MKLPREGANELSKHGFNCIALNLTFQDYKGPKRSNLGILLLFCNFLKTVQYCFSFYE